jgi:hypothetical protein
MDAKLMSRILKEREVNIDDLPEDFDIESLPEDVEIIFDGIFEGDTLDDEFWEEDE